MHHAIPESTRRTLAHTLPLLEHHREALVSAMEASLRSAESRDEAFGQSEVTAMMLVDLLIGQGRRLAQAGRPGGLDDTSAEHRALDIDGRHYSRFGDSLVAILRDELGPRLPRGAASAWCDAFWTIVRAMQSEPEPVRA